MSTMLSHKNFFAGKITPACNKTSKPLNSSEPVPVLLIGDQFVETGCENCDFLSMENSSERVLEVSITLIFLNTACFSASQCIINSLRIIE
jgi:hypothetical protein